MTTAQDPSTSTQIRDLQNQGVALARQLAGAEARSKSYEQQMASKKVSDNERDLNRLVRQSLQNDVVGLRGQLDAVRQQVGELKSNVGTTPQVIARVEDGPVIVTNLPAALGTTEPPLTLFGLTPHELRGPAEFLLLFPLVLALSRWIWRRSPARPGRDTALEGNPQITRLEQAVESIAIEVERIGEAQRFSAKLMSERSREPLVERLREPVKPQRRVVTPLP